MTRILVLAPIVAIVPVLGLPASTAAEEFALRGGGRISGELLNPEQEPRTDYAIRLGPGGRIVLPAAAVDEVRPIDPAEAEYRRIRPGYADTAGDQWALAEWCREHGLDGQRQTHLRRTVELDPDHAEARRILGYSKQDGEWKTPDEVMADRGYVRYKGRWRTPQEVQLMERDEKLERARKEWYVKIRRWRDWLTGDRAAEGRRQLLGITDPLAVPGLADHLKDEERPQARILFIEALANVGTPSALETLARQAMEDPIEEVRLTCLDYLKKTQSPEVVGYFAGRLKDKDNRMINRAGVALGAMGSPAAVSPLIDALVTEHKFKLVPRGGGGSMSATFPTGGSGGGGGLSMNQKPKIVKQLLRNQAVLDALIEITDQNYGYNQQAWKHWLVSQRRRIQFDPRRD